MYGLLMHLNCDAKYTVYTIVCASIKDFLFYDAPYENRVDLEYVFYNSSSLFSGISICYCFDAYLLTLEKLKPAVRSPIDSLQHGLFNSTQTILTFKKKNKCPYYLPNYMLKEI